MKTSSGKSFIKGILLFVSVFFLYTNFASALVTCPGRPNSTLSWSSSNVVASGCSLQPSASGSALCEFNPQADSSGSQIVTNGTSCTATLSCTKSGSTLATDSDTLTYDSTKVWNGTACVNPPSGDIKANNLDSGATCTIASGASNCTGTISWSTSNVSSASVWYTNDGVNPGSGTTGSFTVNWMRYGANNFKLCNGTANCSTSLDTVTLTGVCASGTSWNGSSCAAAPVPYSCTGSIAANASAYDSEESTSLTANTAWSYSGTDTSTKCQYTCNGGYSWNGSSCTATSGSSPSATISVANCYISAGASTCSGTVTWTSSNLTATPSVQQNGTQFSTAAVNSTGVSRTLQYGNPPANNFTFIHNGTTLDSNMGTGLCASGTTWNTTTLRCETVAAPSAPDLIVSLNNFPASANTNSAVTLSAYISNQGTGSTGASFYNFIQVATAANGGGTITDLSPALMSALASGNNALTSRNHTFTSAGTYSVRACADKSDRNTTTATDSVNESDENNNCGSWSTITVSAPAGLDVTVGSITPTTGTEGVMMVLQVPVINSEDPSNPVTGQNQTRFQRSNFSNGSSPTLINTTSNTGSHTASVAFTPPTVGTYYVQACTDNLNNITEVNEGNNCTPWTAIVISNGSCPLPWGGTINNGQSITAYNTPSVTDPDTCTLHSETRVCNNGTLSDPSGTGSYTYGTCSSTPPAPPVTFLNITPRTVPKGNLVKMNWSISNPTSQCRITASVHRPTSCNAACETERSAAESGLNNTLERGRTNVNDPYGASRNMTGGNGALTKAVSGTSAKGEKSVNMSFTTTFTLSCGATSTSSKVYIYVSDSNEG